MGWIREKPQILRKIEAKRCEIKCLQKIPAVKG